jgi:signal peptide peptidase-like 3
VGIAFAAHPLLQILTTAKPVFRRRLLFCSRWQVQLGEALLAGFSGISVLLWMFTGSMALNNLLGICLCISFISFVRLPSLKVTTYLLSALFFYDIFWVFFSEGLFGKNVMVEAATKQAENPAVLVLQALHMPSSGLAQNLDLPVKLVFPGSLLDWDPLKPGIMLGLGDMALPGMLIALLYSEDVLKWQLQYGGSLATVAKLSFKSREFWMKSYVLPSWVGYIVGMFLALGIGTVFQAAQPALLYLVPCTLLPAVVRASRRKELRELWEGWENVGEGSKVDRKEPDV